MHSSQLMIPEDLRPSARPFRPLVAMGVTAASWVLGCALATDPNNDSRSGLQSGGPMMGCFMTAKIDCPLRCSEIDFDAVCDATLGAACDGQCGAEATGTCLDSCNSDCGVDCAANGDVSCHVACDGRCEDNCRKLCAGAWNAEQCRETCDGQCDQSCQQHCQKRVDASCNGTCKASCNATCSVEAHVACQIRCSVDGFTTCKAKVAAQCVAECSSAVMLTCSDPSTMPAEDMPDGMNGAAPLDPRRSVGVDDISNVRGFARYAPRPPGLELPFEEPPPLVEASPRSPEEHPDASADSVEPRSSRGSEGSSDGEHSGDD
ncbi:MAG: hypothetical protein KF764_35480 [Labilithrix sp.]|nr:hypothetical protein [Labilithrix sp.]MBX3224712.1 hypothetical protein [Labilithrix sp.]